MFENSYFIKPDIPFSKEYTGKNHAPLFRKKFTLSTVGKAQLSVCGLGIACYYINGKAVSGDLFTAPVSDYRKTLWYNSYDVTDLLQEGENIFAVICGNGLFNEDFFSPWEHNKVSWRDLPQFIMELTIDGKTILTSDASWLCQSESAVTFNGLRSGEHFDLRLYDPDWKQLFYDDSSWSTPQTLKRSAVFRKCECEPIRECKIYQPKAILRSTPGCYVYDFGQNMSGYVRLTVQDGFADALTIQYAEQIEPDLSLQLNKMDELYKESPFQTDCFTGNGKAFIWSPHFAYHGFRYAKISGISDLNKLHVEGIFVHQDVNSKTSFTCSDPYLTQLFKAGIVSSYSNMFYELTDCPTREKLGWTNDAQASAEQFLTNFEAESLFRKWLYDIYDAMREDGSLPGIIPTPGWGYHWGNGPVSDGVLFELPYRIYLHCADSRPLVTSLPYFTRYLEYLDTKKDADGWVSFGLGDWANPTDNDLIPVPFINAILMRRFYQITALAANLAGENALAEENQNRMQTLKALIKQTFLNADGRCTIHEQTAVAMMIYYDLYEELTPLGLQLKELVEANHFHHCCGMVGARRLFHALSKCGLPEYAYRILTTGGFPGYKNWFDHDATTLWEYWNVDDKCDSKNHHMYSDILSWLYKNVTGIRQTKGTIGEKDFTISPFFFKELTFAEGSFHGKSGELFVRWERERDRTIRLMINIGGSLTARFQGNTLGEGNHLFTMKDTPDPISDSNPELSSPLHSDSALNRESDLELAIKALPGHSIVLCKGGQILTSDKRGIAPMADWIAEEKDLAGYCAADLIVGKAAAMLFFKAGIRSVYADTLSESGKKFLEDHGIPVRFRHLTPMIENRSKTGICPMECTVLDITDAESGCRLLLEKLAALRAGKP